MDNQDVRTFRLSREEINKRHRWEIFKEREKKRIAERMINTAVAVGLYERVRSENGVGIRKVEMSDEEQKARWARFEEEMQKSEGHAGLV